MIPMCEKTNERSTFKPHPPIARSCAHRAGDWTHPTRPIMPKRLSIATEALNTIDIPIFSGVNLQPSMKLTYPDLSSSSFATQHDSLCPLPVSSSACLDPQTGDHGRAEDDDTKHKPAQASLLSERKPFRSPLGFHIPTHRLEAALKAEPGSMSSYWQYSLYRGPKGDGQTVKVHYCKTRESMESVSQLFANENVIGFDIEWKAQAKATDGIKRNVSLIQIANEERIALFHLARFPRASDADDYVGPTFRGIMESPNVTKVGVAIKGDCTRLRNFLNIHCRGLFELSYLYRLIKYYHSDTSKINRWAVSLAKQVEEHLQLPLLKGDVQTSDWSKDLDYDQARCKPQNVFSDFPVSLLALDAASDSYAVLQLFHCLEAKRMALCPVPPRPAHAELNQKLSFQGGIVATATSNLSNSIETSFSDSHKLDVSVEDMTRDLRDCHLRPLAAPGPYCEAQNGVTRRVATTAPSALLSARKSPSEA
ncbi:MAG: hypothetical protein Q9163_003370 [Psora crenata]